MTARHATTVVLLVVAVGAVGATACSDDDAAADTTVPLTTVDAAATRTPPTTQPPTTPPPTPPPTAPPTTVDIEALKAQVAADYLRSEQAREDLIRNPTLDGLEARVATIAAPGSSSYQKLLEFVQGMVARGEHVVPGTPDYSDVIIESVEIADATSTTAVVTACTVFNSARVGPDGVPLDRTGVLYAVLFQQPVQSTTAGWLPAGDRTGLSSVEGATSCAAR